MNRRHLRLRWLRSSIAWMTAGACVSIGVMTWFGYHATREWQRTSRQLADRRADETADRLVTALTRDMRGAQESVLMAPNSDGSALGPHDLSSLVASAFARYPYPEFFFSWRAPAAPEATTFFERSDRPPPWGPPLANVTSFPVTVGFHPNVGVMLGDRIRKDAMDGRPLSMFELRIREVRYQVVARPFYTDAVRDDFNGILGFAVNLDWIRTHYFRDVASQVAHIGTLGAGLDLIVRDDAGRLITHTQPEGGTGLAKERRFSLAFFDPRLIFLASDALSPRVWSVEVAVSRDPTVSAAEEGANRALFVIALAAVALAVGLLMSGSAARQRVELAEVRSEFVSTVTHELKTPLALIRAAGGTVVAGRVSTAEASRQYAEIVVREARRLTRLVDNLLAYARVTDVAEIYSFEVMPVELLISDALDRARAQLASPKYDVNVDTVGALPLVNVDPTAMELLFDNLIDNAIRYSGQSRWLSIRTHTVDNTVFIAISDRGIGLHRDEIERVMRKFVRGRSAKSGGSGLGLPIAARIAKDHGGAVSVDSAFGTGTTVTVTLPIWTQA